MTESDLRAELERAQRTIAQQAIELTELRARVDGGADIRGLLAAVAAGGTESDPALHTELLDLIVQTATTVLGAEAASLFLIDPEEEELIFQVAIGGAGETLRGTRFPMGAGIVGFVAATGNPLVVNDVAQEPRFAASFAQSVGYVPTNILAVPMLHAGDVVGVLEVLNKRGGAEGFTGRDIEVLGMFANQAAVAVGRSVATRDMVSALRSAVEEERAADTGAEVRSSLAPYALRLATLLEDIGRRGDEERALCLALMEAVHAYVDATGREL